jgi:hypothetical protein
MTDHEIPRKLGQHAPVYWAKVYNECDGAGETFWLNRKRLRGSYRHLMAASRA